MRRYEICWITSFRADKGCTVPPFQYWSIPNKWADVDDNSGQRHFYFFAFIDASNSKVLLKGMRKYFPDIGIEYIEIREDGYIPLDLEKNSFAAWENRTFLKIPKKQDRNMIKQRLKSI